jgi:hypothetical protein
MLADLDDSPRQPFADADGNGALDRKAFSVAENQLLLGLIGQLEGDAVEVDGFADIVADFGNHRLEVVGCGDDL